MALIVAWIEPIGLRGAPEVVLERGEIVLSEKPRHLAPRSTSESHISQQLSGRRPHCRSEGTETNRNGAGRPSLITRFRAANSHIPDGAPSVGRNSGARDGENCVVALGDRVHIMWRSAHLILRRFVLSIIARCEPTPKDASLQCCPFAGAFTRKQRCRDPEDRSG